MPTCLDSLKDATGVTSLPKASVPLKERSVFNDDIAISSVSGSFSGIVSLSEEELASVEELIELFIGPPEQAQQNITLNAMKHDVIVLFALAMLLPN
jgi:hypothetical protein